MVFPFRLLTLSVLSLSLTAQTISPEFFNALKWRLLGPFRGGRSVAVTGQAGGGSTFLFGSVGGGVWKTTDAGRVWTPIFDEHAPVASIGALEMTPSDPNVIYAGTGESDIRSDLASGDGVYKSADGGKSWRNAGLKETRQISRVVVDPHNANVVYVAALGHAYGPNPERGVFKSSDGGETWTKVLDRGPQVGAADLTIASDEPSVLFAAMWEAHRPPWSTYAPIGGAGSGLFRSRDGGQNWSAVTSGGFPTEGIGRIGVAIAPGTHGRRVYASVEAAQGRSGIYRSDDGGDTWNCVNNDPRVTSRAWYFSSITVDPNDPDVLYIPNVAVYKLSDGGKTISIVRGAPGGDDYHQTWIDPANSAHMVLGTDQGTTISLDGGGTWSSWYNQPTAQFYHVAVDHEFPYHIYGAQQDSGSAAVPGWTDHSTIDGRDWFTVGGSESGYIALDSKDPNIFYLSGTFGSVQRFDKRTGQSQNITPWPVPEGIGKEISQRKYRDPWTPMLVSSSAQPGALYLGTQYVMRTLDGGLHWQTISRDLTGAKKDAATKGDGPVDVASARERGYGVVYSIAPSPLSAALIWAGSDTGLIHVTRDGGKNWADVTPPGLTAWSKIALIEASHFSAGEAYAAVDRHRLDDMKPYLFRTRDFGKTWTPIVSGIGERAFVNAIREDPKRRGLLFAGTESGVYVSFNNGDQWQPLQLNLPTTSIRDLAVHADDLIVATHGRSFWVLDDIAPLRQLATEGTHAEPWLLKPARAMRIKNDGFWGTPLPPEEPQTANPARGAYIDYYLPGSESEVRLEILDGSGKVIRRFSNRETPPAAASNRAIAPRWFPKPVRLSGEPGMHRFVWDLRYGAVAEELDEGDDDNPRLIGPLAVPGVYKARLKVGSRELVQAFEVAMDPRCRATRAELLTQFNWAMRAFEKATQVNELLKQVKASAKQGKANDPVKNLNTKLEEISRNLTAASSAIQSADRVPTSQAIAVYVDAAKQLQIAGAEWKRMKGQGTSAGEP